MASVSAPQAVFVGKRKEANRLPRLIIIDGGVKHFAEVVLFEND